MRGARRVRGSLFPAAVLALGLVIAPSPSAASALGEKTGACAVSPYAGIVTGESTVSYAITYISWGTCGSVGVQVSYRPYGGSPLFNSAWTYGSHAVSQYQSVVEGGGHSWPAGSMGS